MCLPLTVKCLNAANTSIWGISIFIVQHKHKQKIKHLKLLHSFNTTSSAAKERKTKFQGWGNAQSPCQTSMNLSSTPKTQTKSCTWRHTPAIPALGRQRQRICEAHWPVVVSPGPGTDTVSRNKVGSSFPQDDL